MNCIECDKNLRGDNNSGYCRQHHHLSKHIKAKTKRRKCLVCGKKLNLDNVTNYCSNHRSLSSRLNIEKNCLECGVKLHTITNKSGYCRKHRNLSNQVKDYNKTWTNTNRLRVNKKNSEWTKSHRGKHNAKIAKRKAAQSQRTPHWLSKNQLKIIEQFYIDANIISYLSGIPQEVDHIVPLQGREVSGLHVPWNLQILSKYENSSKSNRLENL